MIPLHRLPQVAGLRWLAARVGLGPNSLAQRWRTSPKALPAPHAWQCFATGRKLPLYRTELTQLLMEDWFGPEAPGPLNDPPPQLYNRAQLGEVLKFRGMHQYTHEVLERLPDAPPPYAAMHTEDGYWPMWDSSSTEHWKIMLARRHPKWARQRGLRGYA